MLIGLFEPRLFVSTSVIPTASSTARTGPPAITPVPGRAGFSSTRPAPWCPSTSWGIVPSISGTSIISRRACSRPFRLASDTSFAFPSAVPIPDRHQRSEREPASALHDLRHAVHEHHVLDQLRIRPGTTAARAASLLSRHALLLLAPPGVALELESAGARAFGKRGDTPMIEITAAIEHDPLHPDRLRPLRQQLPGLAAQIRLRRLRVLPQRLQLRRLRRNTDQDLPAHIVDEVPLNVLQRAEHHQPR